MKYPLAWSLIHFLWEGAVMAMVLRLLLFACRRDSARVRYGLACAALLAMPLAVAVTYWVSAPDPRALVLPTAVELGDGQIVTGPAAALRTPLLQAVLPWVGPLWMAGVLAFYLRTLASWILGRRLLRAGVCAAATEWQRRLTALCQELRVSRPVVLLESCLVEVPVVMGMVRPVILMPVGILAGLSTSQVESILIHELAHIRRWDYVVNLLQSVAEGLLFYHPAVWWVSKQIRMEREHCCDDVVVRTKGDAREYAATLATLESNRWPAQEAALAATGGNLMKRIRRLLQEPEGHRGSAAPVFVVGLLLVSLGVAIAERPQKAALATPRPVEIAQVQTPPTPERKSGGGNVVSELTTPYKKWLTEDVAYIITNEERSAFKRLQMDEEREKFIEQFWLRRDPTPATFENEMREEHYRRFAYANEHWAASVPGWKTDRGRIYITYGPPDEIDSHPSGDASSFFAPYERWMYRWIEGVGNNVVIEFVDAGRTGDYHMTSDPSVRQAPTRVKTGATVQKMGATAEGGRLMLISIPLDSYGGHAVNLLGTITSTTRRPISNFEKSLPGSAPLFTQVMTLVPGSYRLMVVVKDNVTGGLVSDEIAFEVN